MNHDFKSIEFLQLTLALWRISGSKSKCGLRYDGLRWFFSSVIVSGVTDRDLDASKLSSSSDVLPQT